MAHRANYISWGPFYEHSNSWRALPGTGPIGGGLGSGAAWGTSPYIGSGTFGVDGPWERASRHWGGRSGTEGGFEPGWARYPNDGTWEERMGVMNARPDYFRRSPASMDSRFPVRRPADPRFRW